MEKTELSAIEYCNDSYENILLKHAAEKNIPIQGEIEITSKCNFKCIHCYVDQEKTFMDIEIFKKIVKQLKEKGCVWLLITGGEPLTHPDFDQMWLYAYNLGLRISLFTNGSKITDETIQLLKKAPPENIEVSIYSLKNEIQKKITGTTINISNLISKLSQISSFSQVVLKTPLLTDNMNEINDIEKLAKRHGFGFRMDAIIHPSISGNTCTIEHRVPAKIAASIVMKDEEMQFQLQESNANSRLPFETDGYLFPCSAGKYSFHIDNEANLNMCSIYRNEISCLKNETFEVAWGYLTKLREEQKAIPNNRCDDCKIKNICSSCPAIPKLYNESPYFIDEYICEYTHEIASLANIELI